MSRQTMPAPNGSENVQTVDGVISGLTTISAGDRDFLCALACAALSLDDHAREKLLHEVTSGRGTGIGTPSSLTRRQHEVLELLSDGLTVQAIARRLCLSPRTVDKHLERLYRRLGTSDRLTTVLRAQRYGLLAKPVWPAAV